MSDSKQLKIEVVGNDKSGSSTVKKLGNEVDKTEKKARKLGQGFKVAGAAIAAGLAVGAVAALVFAKKSVVAFNDAVMETNKLKRAMGGTAQDASTLRFAFNRLGIGTDQASALMGKFSKQIVKPSKEFKALGIETKDASGKLLSTSEVLGKVMDKFKAMPDGAQKSALALQLFGRQGMALLPFLNKGSAGLADLKKQAHDLGFELSDNEIKQVMAATAAKKDMTAAVNGLKIRIGAALSPAITILATKFRGLVPVIVSKLMPAVQDMGTKFANFATTASDKVVPAITNIGKWIKEHKPLLEKIAKVIGVIGGAMLAWKLAGPVLLGLTVIVRGLAAAWGAVSLAMDANPIGLIALAISAAIAGVVLLAAGFAVLYAKCKPFQDAVNGIIQQFKEQLGPLLRDASAQILPVLQKAFQDVGKTLAENKEGIAALIGIMKVVIIATIPAIIGGIKLFAWALQSIIASASLMAQGVKFSINTIINILGVFVNSAAFAFGWIPGIGPKIKSAAATFNAQINSMKTALNSVQSKTVTITLREQHIITQQWINKDKAMQAEGRAIGGPVTGRTPYVVGERGPELFIPDASGTILTNRQSFGGSGGGAASGAGGGTSPVTVNITVEGALVHQNDLARVVRDALARLQKQNGGRLGLA